MKKMENGSSEEDRVKFLQEAAIMGQFKHPNIVKIFGILKEGDDAEVRLNCYLLIINPQRMREGYSTHCVCLCVYVCVTYDSGGYADLQR